MKVESQGDCKTLGSTEVLIVDPTLRPEATGTKGNHTWVPDLGAFMLMRQTDPRMDPLHPTDWVDPERRARYTQLTCRNWGFQTEGDRWPGFSRMDGLFGKESQ